MNITVHHSGSAGNCYQVDDLLIEAGVPIAQIKKALKFRLSEIKGCLVSHSHGDHAKAIPDLIRSGVDVWMGGETAKALKVSGHRVHICEPGEQFRIGGFNIKGFPLVHDVENFGFLIAKNGETLLYVTDTNYIPQRFKRLNYVMIGVDYDAEILKRNIEEGTVDMELGKRILRNHMSLQTALDFFKANDMKGVREIHLLHLSDSNSDEEKFKREVERITGRPVYLTPSLST